MKTKYIISKDGAKIAYSTSGHGPALFLVHGMGAEKSMWNEMGWVEVLKEHFTTIAVDIRGYGESDKSYEPEFYAIENILADLNMIIKECGFSHYCYFGHSYGATIGLQVSRNNPDIKKIVCAGSTFGDAFFKKIVPNWISEYEKLILGKKLNQLHDLNLSVAEIEWVEKNDLELKLAQLKAWNQWAGIEPDEISSDLAIYSGTNDYPFLLEILKKQQDQMRKYSINFKIFDQLDHVDLVKKIDIVTPWVLKHLL